MRPQYFTLSELLFSRTAIEKKISNIPSFEQVSMLCLFGVVVLDPIRRLHGSAIAVTSGFRSYALNKAVGGVENSHHCCEDGYVAADISTGSFSSNRVLFDLIHRSTIPYCELICENGGEWIHVSWNPQKGRERAIMR